MRRSVDSERGSVTALVAVVAIALVMVAGMAYDGGKVIAAHAAARSHAAKAARAGAQEIDLTVLRQSGQTTLDPAAAEAAALAYLEETGTTDGVVTVEDTTVTVTVTVVQPMHILPLPDRTVVATESASAVSAADVDVEAGEP